MKDKIIKNHESRRKLLKFLAAGSGVVVAGKQLPESWSRPVVDSVLLPVHAQTSCSTTFAGTYDGNATTLLNRCNGAVNEPRTPPLTVIIGADCSVSVSVTGNRPLTGTGTIIGNTFSVAVSRTEDCAAPAGRNDATGTVTGTVNATQITGTVNIGGSCDCGSPAVPNFSNTGTYTINLV
ncbi:MAG: hypothetical protein BMS9Abin25_0225 [Gammaproteobacteria bacterium]|nr:MAG: hypothetical protein BMS9Abin25_0225 [Gammaproteobacteria bacterium]